MAKPRILFYGDAPTVATGFGTVSREILLPLQATGEYDIKVLGVNYWGEPHDYNIPIWPVAMNKQNDPYGRAYIQERIMQEEFDVLFMIQDSFILDFIKEFIPKLHAAGKKFTSIVYFPIDGTPKEDWIRAMSFADVPVTYTQFGYNECKKAYPSIADRLKIIPHGINPSTFFPIPYGDSWAFRRKFFGPLADHFIISNINRNQQRKDIPRFLMAFKEFQKKCPKSMAYLHCAAIDQGWNLPEVVSSMGLEINKDVVFPHHFGPNKGFPVEILNMIYNASDVVASSTTGEGWGLSFVEAMATMTPVVAPQNTACAGIVGDGRGLLVKSGADLEHFTVLPHDNEVVRPLIDIQDMADAFYKLYTDDLLRVEVTRKAYDWVTSELDWANNIVPKWKKIIDDAINSVNTNDCVSTIEI